MGITIRIEEDETPQAQVRSGHNIHDVRDYGAKGDFFGNHDGIYTGITKTLHSPTYEFTTEDIGKDLMVNGFGTIVVDVLNGNAICDLDKPDYDGKLWYVGTDDTAAIQAAIDAAHADQPYEAGMTGGGDQAVPMGGTVVLNGNYLVSNSYDNWNSGNGKTSALIMRKRVALLGTLYADAYASSLNLAVMSFGDIIGNIAGQKDDFMRIGNMSIVGYGAFSWGARHGINLDVSSGWYPRIDTFSRVHDIFMKRIKHTGVRYKGRGEAEFHNIVVSNAGGHGFHMEDSFDLKLTNLTGAGTGLNGIRFTSTGDTSLSGSKFFYNGSAGGDSAMDSAGIAIVGNQHRDGGVQITNSRTQETRGSGLFVNIGGNQFSNVRLGDAGRTAVGTQDDLPSVIAGVHLESGEARMNTFSNVKVTPSVKIWEDQNASDGDNEHAWGNCTHAVYVSDAVDGYGAQENSGDITVTKATMDSDLQLDQGLVYPDGFTVFDDNGLNNGLIVN